PRLRRRAQRLARGLFAGAAPTRAGDPLPSSTPGAVARVAARRALARAHRLRAPRHRLVCHPVALRGGRTLRRLARASARGNGGGAERLRSGPPLPRLTPRAARPPSARRGGAPPFSRRRRTLAPVGARIMLGAFPGRWHRGERGDEGGVAPGPKGVVGAARPG